MRWGWKNWLQVVGSWLGVRSGGVEVGDTRVEREAYGAGLGEEGA